MASADELPEVSPDDLVIWDESRSRCCGYLNKKASKSSAFSKGQWQKRWFSVNIDIEPTENYTIEYSHSADGKAKQVFHLVNATVKLAGGSNFVINFVDDTILTLSAENGEIMKAWVTTLENVILVANQREKIQHKMTGGGREDSLGARKQNSRAGNKSASLLRGGENSSVVDAYEERTEPDTIPSPQRSPHRGAKVSNCPMLRVDIDIESIPPASNTRRNFVEFFEEDLTKALEVVPGLVEVISIKPAPGMDWLTVVEFDINASAIPIDEETPEDEEDPDYLEEIALEQEDIRTKLLETLSDMVLDTSSPLYQGFVTCKLDASFQKNLTIRSDIDEAMNQELFSTDPVVLDVMERYKDIRVPASELDITSFNIELNFEGTTATIKVPNPLVLRKRCCMIFPFEVKKALGFMGTMQEMWIEPTALIPKNMPSILTQPILFQCSARASGEKAINATLLAADQSYDVICEDRREEALNELSEDEMTTIKATFQQFDINNDGGISREEIQELVRHRTLERRAQIEEKFEAFANEKGVTRDELEAAEENKAMYMQQLQESQTQMLKMFEAADTNGNGIISFTEFIMAEAWWMRCTINPDKAHLF